MKSLMETFHINRRLGSL